MSSLCPHLVQEYFQKVEEIVYTYRPQILKLVPYKTICEGLLLRGVLRKEEHESILRIRKAEEQIGKLLDIIQKRMWGLENFITILIDENVDGWLIEELFQSYVRHLVNSIKKQQSEKKCECFNSPRNSFFHRAWVRLLQLFDNWFFQIGTSIGFLTFTMYPVDNSLAFLNDSIPLARKRMTVDDASDISDSVTFTEVIDDDTHQTAPVTTLQVPTRSMRPIQPAPVRIKSPVFKQTKITETESALERGPRLKFTQNIICNGSVKYMDSETTGYSIWDNTDFDLGMSSFDTAPGISPSNVKSPSPFSRDKSSKQVFLESPHSSLRTNSTSVIALPKRHASIGSNTKVPEPETVLKSSLASPSISGVNKSLVRNVDTASEILELSSTIESPTANLSLLKHSIATNTDDLSHDFTTLLSNSNSVTPFDSVSVRSVGINTVNLNNSSTKYNSISTQSEEPVFTSVVHRPLTTTALQKSPSSAVIRRPTSTGTTVRAVSYPPAISLASSTTTKDEPKPVSSRVSVKPVPTVGVQNSKSLTKTVPLNPRTSVSSGKTSVNATNRLSNGTGSTATTASITKQDAKTSSSSATVRMAAKAIAKISPTTAFKTLSTIRRKASPSPPLPPVMYDRLSPEDYSFQQWTNEWVSRKTKRQEVITN